MRVNSIFPHYTRHLAGIPLVVTTPEEAAVGLCRAAVERNSGEVHLLNAYSIAVAEANPEFRECLVRSSFNLPDGKPLSILTRWGKHRLVQVRGPALFEDTLNLGRSFDLKHYFLGSTEETLNALSDRLKLKYPGLDIAGTFSPPFRHLEPHEIKDQDDRIAAVQPHIVWVGLGTPKQDIEAARLAREAGFLAVAVGAAFDFSAGTKAECPEWLSKLGLEWAFRFGSEPKRLWKRYLLGNFVFLYAVAKGLAVKNRSKNFLQKSEPSHPLSEETEK